jgi:hypothetical protein
VVSRCQHECHEGRQFEAEGGRDGSRLTVVHTPETAECRKKNEKGNPPPVRDPRHAEIANLVTPVTRDEHVFGLYV